MRRDHHVERIRTQLVGEIGVQGWPLANPAAIDQRGSYPRHGTGERGNLPDDN